MIPLWLAFFFALQDQPPDKCTVSGVVVNSVTGEPLNKVQVLAEKAGDRDHAPASTITGAKGEFTLVQLDPGQYRLKGVRNGYLETYYGARRAQSKGTTLTLEPGQESKDLQLKLLPFAVIAGTVRDPEGEALSGARVSVLALRYRGGREQVLPMTTVTTDDLGQYRIADLSPGRYYARAALQSNNGETPVDHSPKDAPAPEILVPTLHPASRDLAGARRIEVTPGTRSTGADITLLRSRTYRVRVQAEGPAGLGLGLGLHERPELGDGLSINPPSHCQRGVCEFAGVPSGSYEVTASASQKDRRGTFEELFFNSHDFRASVPVEVANADVDGVRIVVNPGAEIAGQVRIAGEEQPTFPHGAVDFESAGDESYRSPLAPDGTFISRLSQGRYKVLPRAGPDLVVRSIRSEDTDVLQEGLTVAHGGKLPLEIVLARDGGKIDGTVLDKDDKPSAGATVVLMPEAKLRFRHDLFQQTETDQYGRFQFKTIAPGDYQLFAWDDVEPGIWFDPDFMKDIERRGEPVTVHAKGQEQGRLHLLP